jgi:hypothetical protein
MTAINARMLDRELKKGSAELIILSIVHAMGLITGVDHA